MSMNQSDYDRLQGALVQSVRDHWVLFLVEGLILVVLGDGHLASVVASDSAGITSTGPAGGRT